MAYAFVKCVNNATNGAVVTFSPTNAGDLLIVISDTSAGGGSPTASITDNLSSSWQTAAATFNSGIIKFLTAFYLPNCPAGITSITLSYAGGTPGTVTIGIFEYSGIATSSPLIVASTFSTLSAPGTGANAVASAAINVTTQPALLFGILVDRNTNTTLVAGTGFTARQTTTLHNAGWLAEDSRLTATGNNTAKGTDATNGGTDPYVVAAFAFAEPAVGPAPPAGSASLGGNAPTVISNTILVPQVARQYEPERGILMPSRKIFLPSRSSRPHARMM